MQIKTCGEIFFSLKIVKKIVKKYFKMSTSNFGKAEEKRYMLLL